MKEIHVTCQYEILRALIEKLEGQITLFLSNQHKWQCQDDYKLYYRKFYEIFNKIIFLSHPECIIGL